LSSFAPDLVVTVRPTDTSRKLGGVRFGVRSRDSPRNHVWGGTLEAFEMSIAYIIRRYAGTNVHVFNLLLGLHHAMNGSI